MSSLNLPGFSLIFLSVLIASAEAQVADDFSPAVSGGVNAIALQPDGKILVGGNFTSLAGSPCTNIGRLYSDGSFDSTFHAGANLGSSICIQPDGKILVASELRVARLNADGSMDAGFRCVFGGSQFSKVNVILLTPNNGILVGGSFTSVNGTPCGGLCQLSSSGTTDSVFFGGVAGTLSSEVFSLAVQLDGKVVVGGSFTRVGGVYRTNLCRFNNSFVDSTFVPDPNGAVECVLVDRNSKILVGGWFSAIAGGRATNFARLNADGSLDSTFNAGVNNRVSSAALQCDDSIIIAGAFNRVAGLACTNIGRLFDDGRGDSGFRPAVIGLSGSDFGSMFTLALQGDGRVLAGWAAIGIDGRARGGLGRWFNTGTSTAGLAFDGSKITWLRSGTSPELSRVSFERLTTANTWTVLGPGSRIAGGWQRTVSSFSTNSVIRAKGYVQNGYGGRASWFLEQWLAPPLTSPRILCDDGKLGFSGGRFGFSISGSAAPSIIIEGSSNGLDWLPLATNNFSAGSFFYSDPASGSRPGCVYRARIERGGN